VSKFDKIIKFWKPSVQWGEQTMNSSLLMLKGFEPFTYSSQFLPFLVFKVKEFLPTRHVPRIEEIIFQMSQLIFFT